MRDLFVRLVWAIRWIVDGALHGGTPSPRLIWRASAVWVDAMNAAQFRRLT